MKIGAFSISLNVKDIQASLSFYQHLGFEVFAGDIHQKWLILKNEQTVIGLFQGMFEGNLLTFNPGWDQNAQPLESFEDIRVIAQELESKGIPMVQPLTGGESGPASFIIQDPDGNTLLFDQHR